MRKHLRNYEVGLCMWKMNAEKDQSLELPEVSDHQAQSREPRVITRILCWTFFYAEMLLVCAPWAFSDGGGALDRWDLWRVGVGNSLLVAWLFITPSRSSNHCIQYYTQAIHSFNQYLAVACFPIRTFLLADQCSQYLHILSLHLKKSHSIVGHLTAKLS